MIFSNPFIFWRLRERLWVRPLIFCLLAIIALLGAGTANRLGIEDLVPKIDHGTVERLLSIISASMLGVATFAVASMVSAYSSVSSNATPRAFALVISDDLSKTALSTFIAAFIFSVVALIAIKTGYFGRTALFAVFVMTIGVLGWVVFSFVRWVDQIARLGRLGTTIARVEQATKTALQRRRSSPTLGGLPIAGHADFGDPVFSETVGYVQHINIEALQARAQDNEAVLTVAALPGTFIVPGRPLAFIKSRRESPPGPEGLSAIAKEFVIGDERIFDNDPRFGLIVLSEIAARALSPGVNDPGTAIGIIGTFVRLFVLWSAPPGSSEQKETPRFDRIHVPTLAVNDMFDDAFTAIERDGAGTIEVVLKLQKAFTALCKTGNPEICIAASHHAKLSLARAELELKLPYEIQSIRALAEKLF